jgi:hypothetical protein
MSEFIIGWSEQNGPPGNFSDQGASRDGLLFKEFWHKFFDGFGGFACSLSSSWLLDLPGSPGELPWPRKIKKPSWEQPETYHGWATPFVSNGGGLSVYNKSSGGDIKLSKALKSLIRAL